MSETFTDITAIAAAAGARAAMTVIDELRREGWPTGLKQNPTLEDLGTEGPYHLTTLSRFIKEGRLPGTIKLGAHRIIPRHTWNLWLANGGPDAFEKGADGNYHLKQGASRRSPGGRGE